MSSIVESPPKLKPKKLERGQELIPAEWELPSCVFIPPEFGIHNADLSRVELDFDEVLARLKFFRGYVNAVPVGMGCFLAVLRHTDYNGINRSPTDAIKSTRGFSKARTRVIFWMLEALGVFVRVDESQGGNFA